ncbi:MAG: hypothetical protein IRY83_14915 [Chloroflexi bacterium]|nr:hypothetical protein [Chloroflexota bacterium]
MAGPQLDTSSVVVVRFHLVAAPGANGELREEVRHNARITRWRYRFFPGPEATLQIVPAILRRQELIRLWRPVAGGIDYIAGDNEDVVMDADIPVYAGQDEIVVRYANTDATNAHQFVVDVTLRSVEAV